MVGILNEHFKGLYQLTTKTCQWFSSLTIKHIKWTQLIMVIIINYDYNKKNYKNKLKSLFFFSSSM